MLTLALTASMFFAPANSEASASSAASDDAADSQAREEDSGSSHVEPKGLSRYLSRPVVQSPRFLDHGVLQVQSGVGVPHRYRLDLSLGLFDHLSGGVSVHWLALQERPVIAPHGALAIWRGELVEFGLSYRQLLHNPQEEIEAGFALRTHYMSGTLVFSQGWFAGGVDVGAVYFRADTLVEDDPVDMYRNRLLPGGGVFGRFGTRRWGVSLAGRMPVWSLDLALDLRFGLFEKRERGSWRLRES